MDNELIGHFNALPCLVWTVFPDGRAEFINKRWRDYTGLSTEDVSGQAWKALIHPDDLPAVLVSWESIVACGAAGQFEARMRRYDGSYRRLLFRMNPLIDASGRVIKWCGVGIDIDDTWRSQEALRIAERNLGLVINAIPVPAWSNRIDGSAEFFNQHYLDYVGLSAEQVSDWGWMAAVHPDDVDALSSTWRRMVDSHEPGEIEARLRRFDGEYRWFMFRINPLRNEGGGIVKWYGIGIDIDDRKRAEEELRRSEACLAEAQRTSMTGSFSWLLDSDEISFSEELYHIFEFEHRSLVTFDRIEDRIHPDDLPLLWDKRKDARSTGADLDYDVRLLLPNGTLKYVHVVSHCTRDRQGRREYIGAVQDVTQRRISEDALGTLRSELARLAEFNSLGALTASIAHEVNQPLSGVITNASTCLRMLAANPPNVDGALETARRMIRDGHRASDVITRVRALFSKKTSVTECVNLNDAAKEVIALSLSTLKSNRVVVKTDFLDDLPAITGDRIQLQQVILNLLLNASEAMSGIDDRPRQIVIKTEEDDDDRIRLTVQDTGVGIDPDVRSKMFETYYTTKGDGMGIGLSISKSIIERHHGTLRAAPNDGPGARFWFSIPRADEHASDSEEIASVRTFAAGNVVRIMGDR